MSKYVYNYDSQTLVFTTVELVDDDYELGDFQTFQAPPRGPGSYDPIKWINGHWVATSRDNWLAERPQSNSQKMMMQLSQSITTLQSMVMAQNQQLAQLTAKEEK